MGSFSLSRLYCEVSLYDTGINIGDVAVICCEDIKDAGMVVSDVAEGAGTG